MLAQHVAAVQNSVVFVLRFATDQTGTVRVSPVGTACYVGCNTFVTANHLFETPPLDPSEVVRVGFVPAGAVGTAVVFHTPASVDYQSAQHDLAIMTVPGFGNERVPGVGPLPAVRVSSNPEPDGRSVFSYGFITPVFQFTSAGPIVRVAARACASIIAGRYVHDPERYELDSHTYPGESGAPVFRANDHVAIGIVQASRLVQVPPPFGQVRGPTIASPLSPIAGELAKRGIPLTT
ncbi:MAG TPA: trypsin-like peptidase domain-containing protein [Polyangiaceae bacterium]|nr:trypsin-like peptidase domain-containing protein [Polyangiaceae bacterium]